MDVWQNLPKFNGTINTHYVHVVPDGTRRHWYKTDRKSELDIGPFGRVIPPPVEVTSTSISATSRERIPSVTPESNQSMTSKSAQQRKQSSSFKSDSEFSVLNLSTQNPKKSFMTIWNRQGMIQATYVGYVRATIGMTTGMMWSHGCSVQFVPHGFTKHARVFMADISMSLFVQDNLTLVNLDGQQLNIKHCDGRIRVIFLIRFYEVNKLSGFFGCIVQINSFCAWYLQIDINSTFFFFLINDHI